MIVCQMLANLLSKEGKEKKACESAFFSHFEITWEKTLLRGSTISKHINRTCSL